MEKLKQLSEEYAALAQVYRWYQVYDLEQSPIHLQNVLSILSDDITIYTYDGTIKGKSSYLTRLNIQKNWRHANHIKHATFSRDKTGLLTVETELNYQNILPDGSFNSYQVKHQIKFTAVKNALPTISEIRIIPIKISEEKDFVGTYKENRVKSFIYFLLYCFESYKDRLEKINEVFTEEFSIQYNNSVPFSSKEELVNWVRKSASRHVGCYPVAKNIKITELNKDKANVSFDIFWTSLNTQEIMSLANCNCLVHYNLYGYFASIEAMTVSSTLIGQQQKILTEI